MKTTFYVYLKMYMYIYMYIAAQEVERAIQEPKGWLFKFCSVQLMSHHALEHLWKLGGAWRGHRRISGKHASVSLHHGSCGYRK